MSRSSQQQIEVSLFPFLAVLMCVLGALIFLLLVVTRMIREDVYAAESKSAVEERVQVAVPEVTALLVPVEPVAEVPVIELPAALAELSFPSVDLSVLEQQVAELKQQIVSGQARLDANAALLTDVNSRLVSQQQMVGVRQSQLEEATRQQSSSQQSAKSLAMTGEESRRKLVEAQSRLESIAAEKAALEQERTALLQSLTQSSEKLAQTQAQAEKIATALDEKQKAIKSAMEGYQIVPVDSKTGTSRYPILIECSRDGLQFRPEGLTLGPVDMKGFTSGFNPLLAGTKALMSYWEGQIQSGGQRPYILLIVRPSGIESFYAARKYLHPLETEMGYELISDNVPIAVPPLNEEAKKVLEKAVAESLAARNRLAENVTSSSRGGFPEMVSKGDSAFRGGSPSMGGMPESGSPMRGGAQGGQKGRGNSESEMAADPKAGHFDATSNPAATDESRENNSSRPDFTVSSPNSVRGVAPKNQEESPTIRSGATASQAMTWEQVAKDASSAEGSDSAPESVTRLLAKGAMTNRAGQIGIEKRVAVSLDAEQMQFGDGRPVSLVNIQSSEQFRKIFWGMLEAEVASWKSPPQGFYWTPSIKFYVSPGGNRHYTRIETSLKTLRIPITVEQTLEARSSVASPDLDQAFR